MHSQTLPVVNHSFASTDAVVRHLDMNLNVNFDKKVIDGVVSVYYDNRGEAESLILDTRDLNVTKVTAGEKHRRTSFQLGTPQGDLGRPLIISVKPEDRVVTVHYQTSPGAQALQWLSPSQTAGKLHPFLFTQSQAILARSWIPCQDHPGNRITFRAKVKVPKGMMALMGAQNDMVKHPRGEYEFVMAQPIPTYLLALAVGDLDFRAISDRAGVFAEPAIIEKAAWEFGDTEKMIEAAERLYGPYRWGRYDILVLPPSFPFGGMENPKLTFATPTVIAGDRSLVSLVSHELAHSWSGNLVTNATWNDFWLNEGFTTYFERRIQEEVYGKEQSEMEAYLSYQDLVEEVKTLGANNEDTKLLLHLEGRNPDDGVTSVPYDKGYFFLRLIEQSVGRPRWDEFLKGYFEKYAFQTMTTPVFLKYLEGTLFKNDKKAYENLQVDSWIDGPGIPANCPKVTVTSFNEVDTLAKAWSSGTTPAQPKQFSWTTQQWQHFLRALPRTLGNQQMAELDRVYGFSKRGNSEVLFEWFMLSIAANYEPSFAAMEEFLINVGRRKFLKPIYTEMAKTPEGRERALRIYERARPGYHAVSTRTIDDILKVEGSTR